MGNSSSTEARMYIPSEAPQSVRFDLRSASLAGAYAFQAAEGRFSISLGLGVQSLEVADPASLALSEKVETVTVPVGAEEKRRLEVESVLGLDTPEVVHQLVSGGGIVISQRRDEGQWVNTGRVDSDLGIILLYSRIASDLKMVLRMETKQPSGWFKSGGRFLIARAEGFIRCQVKARFETEADRQLSRITTALSLSAVAGAVLSLLYLYFIGRSRTRGAFVNRRR